MEWQAVVLVLQILMLAIGWFLFQQARGELSAHAAQTPVLGEVRALQRSIKQLLEELTQTSDRASGQLERRCEEAQDLLVALDRRLEQIEAASRYTPPRYHETVHPLAAVADSPPQLTAGGYRRERNDSGREYATIANNGLAAAPASAPMDSRNDSRNGRQQVYALADDGRTAGEIAQTTGLSVGEVETLLALRTRRGI
jgi:hypothetical protein